MTDCAPRTQVTVEELRDILQESKGKTAEEGAPFLLVLSSGESSGGFAEYTQRGILLVLYDAGMTAAIARQLAVGLQEYVVSDGV